MDYFLEATPRKNVRLFFKTLLLWENQDKLSRLAIFMGTMVMKHQICRVIVFLGCLEKHKWLVSDVKKWDDQGDIMTGWSVRDYYACHPGSFCHSNPGRCALFFSILLGGKRQIPIIWNSVRAAAGLASVFADSTAATLDLED